MTSILWFRKDLRLADNPALLAATQGNDEVVPIYIWSPEEEGNWPLGASSRWWLHHSLSRLSEDLEKMGSRLLIRRGSTRSILNTLIKETAATRILWNRRYEPAAIQREEDIKKYLTSKNVKSESFNASLLFEPWTVKTNEGRPYQVFTPFWRTCTSMPPPAPPRAAPKKIVSPTKWPESNSIEDLKLLPKIPWDREFYSQWEPGERGANKALRDFSGRVINYEKGRDIPSKNGTSQLSPHLHFGEIGPRQLWQALKDSPTYLRELGWREFAHHLLFHFPHTPEKPLRPAFQKFPWEKNKIWLEAWKKGKTGYPLIDAGMRQLWRTGWMHNRVRMIVASFLVKDLRISWTEGAKWFWDTLVDADLANNTLGWQWSAGCGADAAPYFRIFNPESQTKKFDPDQIYIKKWIPELSSDKYPRPIVDHKEVRLMALKSFRSISLSKANKSLGKPKAPK